jgi:hypothetical protein
MHTYIVCISNSSMLSEVHISNFKYVYNRVMRSEKIVRKLKVRIYGEVRKSRFDCIVFAYDSNSYDIQHKHKSVPRAPV